MTTSTRPATLTSDAGAFGAALGTLGFGEFTEHRGADQLWMSTTTADVAFRVTVFPEDGDRVLFLAYAPEYPSRQVEAWRIDFPGSVPLDVALAAIANALGVLPIH